MVFDSMLLCNGGGVSNEFDRASRVRILPTLAIGLGGTGVAALAEYKKALWKRVVPDNPSGDVPQYRGISCLAIDSDPEELSSPRWTTVFSESEKLLLADRNLESQIRNGRLEWITRIKNDPCYSWFDAENVIVNGPLCGCHGNRQLGRYYLFEKINDLFRMLSAKMNESISWGFPHLTVHMFVGLSGGFGSGTFADLCYILRNLAETHHVQLTIIGHLVLPDVQERKAGGYMSAAQGEYMRANGYAALTELDYLMNLQSSGKRFTQLYMNGFVIDTQKAPFDHCFFYSAAVLDSLQLHEFSDALSMAADVAVSFLIDDQNAMTLTSLLSPNEHCHVAVTDSCRIPRDEIEAYFSRGVYRKISDAVDSGKNNINAEIFAEEFVRSLRLTVRGIASELAQGLAPLDLPDIAFREIATGQIIGGVPMHWHQEFRSRQQQCREQLAREYERLSMPFHSDAYHNAPDDSLADRIFRSALDFARDYKKGPGFVVDLLVRSTRCVSDLLYGESCACRDMMMQIEHDQHRLQDDIHQNLERLLHGFIFSRSRMYGSYKDSVMAYLENERTLEILKTVHAILESLIRSVRNMCETYFGPATNLIEMLTETAEENVAYLDAQAHAGQGRGTLRFMDYDLRRMLGCRIDMLCTEDIFGNFMDKLISNSAVWMQHDSAGIARMCHDYFCTYFSDVLLVDFDDAVSYATGTAHNVERHQDAYVYRIFDRMRHRVMLDAIGPALFPMGVNAVRRMYVPRHVHEVCTAADSFSHSVCNFDTVYTQDSSRISMIAIHSGIQIQNIPQIPFWKDSYIRLITRTDFPGIHLYTDLAPIRYI